MNDLYLSGYLFESLEDGIGVRTVLFFSGCNHNCKDCHSKDTHSFTNGEPVTDELIEFINKEIRKRPYLSGITLSGGDPLYSAKNIYYLLDKLYIPNNDIWLYTGFTIDDIIKSKDIYVHKLTNSCSHIVDGLFEVEKRDISSSCKYRGSTNQKIYKNIGKDKWVECK